MGPAVAYPDNHSAMLLGNNGTWSSTKQTRHLKAIYFIVANRTGQGKVNAAYESYVFTKPEQRSAFRKFHQRLSTDNRTDEPAQKKKLKNRAVGI